VPSAAPHVGAPLGAAGAFVHTPLVRGRRAAAFLRANVAVQDGEAVNAAAAPIAPFYSLERTYKPPAQLPTLVRRVHTYCRTKWLMRATVCVDGARACVGRAAPEAESPAAPPPPAAAPLDLILLWTVCALSRALLARLCAVCPWPMYLCVVY
jgi:hypothetical protein